MGRCLTDEPRQFDTLVEREVYLDFSNAPEPATLPPSDPPMLSTPRAQSDPPPATLPMTIADYTPRIRSAGESLESIGVSSGSASQRLARRTAALQFPRFSRRDHAEPRHRIHLESPGIEQLIDGFVPRGGARHLPGDNTEERNSNGIAFGGRALRAARGAAGSEGAYRRLIDQRAQYPASDSSPILGGGCRPWPGSAEFAFAQFICRHP